MSTPCSQSRSASIVTCRDVKLHRSMLLRRCPWLSVGDRCEWHGSGTAAEDDPDIGCADGSTLTLRRGPSSVTTRLVGRARRAHGSRMGDLNPAQTASMARVLTVDGDNLRFSYAERDRSCPLTANDSQCHADPARTKDTSLEGARAIPITPARAIAR
jgi:hypothetical protein